MCISEYVAATFGRNEVFPSYAQFAIPDSVSDDISYDVNVSFLVRTTKQTGLILFLGANTSLDVTNQTFVIIELSPVGVSVRIKLGGETQINVLPCLVADGVQHFVYVSRNYSLLQIQCDDKSVVYPINYSLPLVPDLLYVGGKPLKNTRHRRDTNSSNTDQQFSGTLQDVQLKGIRLQAFPLNTTDDSAAVPSYEEPIKLRNVDKGEQSDDVCMTEEPCKNNATCHNTEGYNEFR